MSRWLALVAACAALAPAAGAGGAATAARPAPSAAATAPLVRELVVFRDGRAAYEAVRAREVSVRIGGRGCGVGAGTALAALVRARPARLRLRDFGSCSNSPRDAAGLFVSGIGGDLNRGRDGWVYKVGTKLATAGAADPAGPFGRGGLRSGSRVTWFYCRLEGRSCQRTLLVQATAEPGGSVAVRVRAYDDEGRAVAAAGATVHAGAATAVTDPAGTVRLRLAPGRHTLFADKVGAVRSPPVEVSVPEEGTTY